MISFNNLITQYPKPEQKFKLNILREYLQYKILQVTFATDLAHKLSFLGGTALRIIHQSARFSEDLDFDNFGLTLKEFAQLTQQVKNGLESEGYKVEIRNIFKDTYRCYLKLPELLYEQGLSGHREEKMLIQLDTRAYNYTYEPEAVILDRFDIFTQIFVTPKALLLSQKILAILKRRRTKGRDFYDVTFLLAQTQPDYGYLKVKAGISNQAQLKKHLLEVTQDLDFIKLVGDMQHFLINPEDSKRVSLFREYIQQALG